MKKTILVDFDGVIHRYSKGWQDGSIYDPPMPGVKEFLSELIKEYEVVIFSTRTESKFVGDLPQNGQLVEMTKWLNDFEIPFSRIHTSGGKPLCFAIIDDRAIQFKGNWDSVWFDLHKLKHK